MLARVEGFTRALALARLARVRVRLLLVRFLLSRLPQGAFAHVPLPEHRELAHEPPDDQLSCGIRDRHLPHGEDACFTIVLALEEVYDSPHLVLHIPKTRVDLLQHFVLKLLAPEIAAALLKRT